jgi:hypothetical protein
MALHDCPACRAKVSAQAGQCGACGVALGEDNRCGRCLAVAPVFERTGRHVCSACGETRLRHPRTIIATEADLLQAFEPASQRRLTAESLLLLLAAVGFVGAAQLALLPRWLAWPAGGLALVAAVRSHYAASSQRTRQQGRRRYEMEQRIIGLAFGNDGMLSAGAVSATLRITINEAKELLGELVATGRARAETNDETGDTSYYFGEAKRTRGIRRNSAL